MNRPGRKLAAGWTFAAGTLFGVLAAFVLPTALHGSRAASHASAAPVTLAAQPADTVPVVVETEAPAAARPEAGSAANAVKAKAPPPAKNAKSPDHFECELQLD